MNNCLCKIYIWIVSQQFYFTLKSSSNIQLICIHFPFDLSKQHFKQYH